MSVMDRVERSTQNPDTVTHVSNPKGSGQRSAFRRVTANTAALKTTNASSM